MYRALLLAALCFGGERIAHLRQPRFDMQEIDAAVGEVCYALATADVDGDGLVDVLAATDRAVFWYSNPTWERRTIADGATVPDNVCLEVADVDRDGRIDVVVGAGWGPLGLRGTEELVWIGREPGSERWAVHPIGPIPSLHRVRIGELGDGRERLFTIPLQGRGVTEPNWGEGPGVQIRAFELSGHPGSGLWPSEIADEGLHTAHGANLGDVDGDGRDELLIAAWEGVFALRRDASGRWARERIGEGYQEKGNSRGASEVRSGRLGDGRTFIATVEPWHGHQLVRYWPPETGSGRWTRRVIDGEATGAHGLRCEDLDGDGRDEIVLARRDADHDLSTVPNAMGVFAYHRGEGKNLELPRQIIDDGGIAAEDLTAADLDGDGRIDLIAGGRETHNVRIYWNRGVEP